MTIPDAAVLSQYEMIIYETGDWYVSDSSTPGFTPPTRYDASALVEYANAGGRVIAIGQDLAGAFGLPDSNPTFYNFTLASDFIQDSVNGMEVFTDTYQSLTGLPGTPFSHYNLDISARGDGAANQLFVDEIRVEDDPDLTAILKYGLPGAAEEDGIVAMGHKPVPSLERPGTTFAGRSLHYAFGLEGVNNDTGFTAREDLAFDSMAWLLDEATVTVTPTVQAARMVTYFEPVMESTYGEGPYSYRWDFGDGTPFTDAESTDSGIFGHVYASPGDYTVRVEATNNLGTTVIGTVEITVGDELEYIGRWHYLFLPLLTQNWDLIPEPEQPGEGD
jgi:hypothetical protein